MQRIVLWHVTLSYERGLQRHSAYKFTESWSPSAPTTPTACSPSCAANGREYLKVDYSPVWHVWCVLEDDPLIGMPKEVALVPAQGQCRVWFHGERHVLGAGLQRDGDGAE